MLAYSFLSSTSCRSYISRSPWCYNSRSSWHNIARRPWNHCSGCPRYYGLTCLIRRCHITRCPWYNITGCPRCDISWRPWDNNCGSSWCYVPWSSWCYITWSSWCNTFFRGYVYVERIIIITTIIVHSCSSLLHHFTLYYADEWVRDSMLHVMYIK